ncbi:MAG: TolC family protein [Bacteroidaceae bacterium]|nr:TolC family protein [Bacteroidaceae bacterium]
MNRRLISLGVLAMLIPGAMVSQSLTLQECIRIGLERNLALKNVQIEVAKGETGIKESRSRLLPTVHAAFQLADYLKEPVNTTTGALIDSDFPDNPTWQKVHSMPWQASAMLTAQLPLWNETIRAATEAAKIVKELKVLGYEKAREQLTMQIAKVYYLVQGGKEQIRLLDEDLLRMKELKNITKALLEQGVVLDTDYRRIGINIASLEAQRGQMKMVYEQQLNTLRFLLDYDSDKPIEVVPIRPRIESTSFNGLFSALPDERLAETRLTLIDRQRRMVRKGYLPSLALFGQAGYLGNQEKFKEFFRSHESHWFGTVALGVKLSIPIFDANQKRLKLRQYRYEEEQASLALQQVRRQNERDYGNALLQLAQNEKVFTTQTEACEQARDVYAITEVRYREGVASMTELLQDDMRLITAEQQVAVALTQWHLAHLEWLRLENKLSDLK